MSNYGENGWSPIIYGRTYEVDFRLLVVPKYFDRVASTQALKYILETTQMPEKLIDRPRWSLVLDRDYYLFGITCTVRDLLADVGSSVPDFTTDNHGRPIYTFIGYVTRTEIDAPMLSLPSYSDLKLDFFRQTYLEYIDRCWEVKNYQSDSRQPLLSKPIDLNFATDRPGEDSRIVLNANEEKIAIWSSDRGADLWDASINSSKRDSQLSLSLVLDLPKHRHLEFTTFLNATIPGWEIDRDGELMLKSKLKPQPSAQLPPSLPVADDDWDEQNDEDTDWKEDRNPSPPPYLDPYPRTLLEILGEIQQRHLEFPHLDRAMQQSIWFYWLKQKNKIQDFSERLSSFNPFELIDFVSEEIDQLLGDINPHDSLSEIARLLGTEVRTLRRAIEEGVRGKTQREIESLFPPIRTIEIDRSQVNRSIGFKPSQDLPPQSTDRTPEDWF